MRWYLIDKPRKEGAHSVSARYRITGLRHESILIYGEPNPSNARALLKFPDREFEVRTSSCLTKRMLVKRDKRVVAWTDRDSWQPEFSIDIQLGEYERKERFYWGLGVPDVIDSEPNWPDEPLCYFDRNFPVVTFSRRIAPHAAHLLIAMMICIELDWNRHAPGIREGDPQDPARGPV